MLTRLRWGPKLIAALGYQLPRRPAAKDLYNIKHVSPQGHNHKAIQPVHQR